MPGFNKADRIFFYSSVHVYAVCTCMHRVQSISLAGKELGTERKKKLPGIEVSPILTLTLIGPHTRDQQKYWTFAS